MAQTNGGLDAVANEPSDIDRLVGSALSRLSKARGWSQTDLAEPLATSQTQVGRYFRGERPIPVTFLLSVCRTIDVEIDSVFLDAGLLHRIGTVESAIDADEAIRAHNKDAAKDMIRGLRQSGPDL